jgi:hypothetical protein
MVKCVNKTNTENCCDGDQKRGRKENMPPAAKVGCCPTNTADAAANDASVFETDEFKMWCMKIIPCTKRFVHDWTVCPFAHTGEKAVRRDPRKYTYTGIACPDMKGSGECIRGDACPYAHNVFEYWLHPTRYRTQLCKDGPKCRRSICFFAHELNQLRIPESKPYVSPEQLAAASLAGIQREKENGDSKKIKEKNEEDKVTNWHEGKKGMLPDISVVGHEGANSADDTPVWTPHAVPSTYSPVSQVQRNIFDAGRVSPQSQQGAMGQYSPEKLLGAMEKFSPGKFDEFRSDSNYSPLSSSDSPKEEQINSLVETLANLKMSMMDTQQIEDSPSAKYDAVVQTVQQVLQQALSQQESSTRHQ